MPATLDRAPFERLYTIARQNNAELHVALRMIRNAIEELGPVGVLCSEEHATCTPTKDSSPTIREAEEIIKGIQKMAGM